MLAGEAHVLILARNALLPEYILAFMRRMTDGGRLKTRLAAVGISNDRVRFSYAIVQGSVAFSNMPSLSWLMATHGKRKSPGLLPPCALLLCTAVLSLPMCCTNCEAPTTDSQAWSERSRNELHMFHALRPFQVQIVQTHRLS